MASPEEKSRPTLMTVRLVTLAQIFNIGILTALACAIAIGPIADGDIVVDLGETDPRFVRNIFFALGAGFPFLSLIVRRKLDARPVTSRRQRTASLLIALALCDVPAILAVLAALILRDVEAVLLLGLFSFVAALMHFPRRRMFEPEHR